MQKNRLFRILYYLINKGTSTAPELAEKFEVSVRTIYRDIDALSSAGIPVYAIQGKGGGISILDNFVLDKSILSDLEKDQILMALQGVLAAEMNHCDELLTKLSSLFHTKSTNWIEVDFSNWVKKNPSQDIFNMIKCAIFNRNIIAFDYFGSNKQSMKRNAEPFKLVFKSKNWYLYGFCLIRNDFRFFKLTRIRNLKIQSDICSHEMPAIYSSASIMNVENTIPVTLKFDKNIAYRVYDEFAEEILEDEEGNLIVHTDLPDNEAFYSYLFSFADSVEIIGPEILREKVKEKLLKMQEKYRT